MIRALLLSRVVQTVILALWALAIGMFLRPDYGPTIAILIGVSPIIAWWIGVHYQRRLVLEAGLVDKDELVAAEQKKHGWRWSSK